MLFHKKHQKKIQAIWMVLSIIVALGMVLLYSYSAIISSSK
ncbi:MAG TPA: hypothetical protein VG694_02155 [Candidatus Paceibacterota bacterium]|jgi:hypothetical protein|nr:hypothetical protein [Candidatus Paceibacterota bacterium]